MAKIINPDNKEENYRDLNFQSTYDNEVNDYNQE